MDPQQNLPTQEPIKPPKRRRLTVGHRDGDPPRPLPNLRTFVVRRPKLVQTRPAMDDAEILNEVAVEAHRYYVDAGALCFEVFIRKGPKIYPQAPFTCAPGTWYDVREITNDFKVKPN